jgi:hypothetical protein
MKLRMDDWFGAGKAIGRKLELGLGLGLGLVWMTLCGVSSAQAVSTTTVQGTVYLANGAPGAGTLSLSWPSFTTGSGQLVTAGHLVVTIAPDGFVSVNLAPNVGATPAGLYYTAVYHMSDGTTSTQYWVIPAAAQASVAQVQAQLMPAAQAVQTVSKAYVDQAITELTGSLLTASGGTLSGPLYLNGDPTQPLQAADKHYVDTQVSTALPISGGVVSGELTGKEIGAVYQADQFAGADFGAKVQACVNGLSTTYGGTCDARNFAGMLAMGSNLTIATANATLLLPCATIATASQVIVTAGTRNVALRGCTVRGASAASGSQGGTVFLYSGAGAMVQVGDATYGADTAGFHMDNAVINTTAASHATAQGLVAYRTQEMDLAGLYFLGNANQTGMTLDGTGNYTGGSFYGNQFGGFQTAVYAIGHQIANAATTDWMNASTFVRLHIDCPTSAGNPIAGTYGINLQQGDGNTFTGGDVENCATAVHLGANAQNNTIVGLRNENSTNQVVADAGSSYNNWMTGGTMFTGQLTDNGTRNSFLDTFHRSFNGMNGDWYGSQQDATVTNHFRIGIGAGNERGLLSRYQTDYGYRWTTGLSDATAGEQFYQVLDELNNVYRLSIGQYNNGQSSTNDQTVINAAGTGAVVLNGSNNAGTGGVVFGSGGPSETTVATINSAGNAQFNGTLQVNGVSTLIGTPTVKNQVDAEIDAILWAGLTQSQKESLIYKDWNGNSQWYAEKDASNNWELNSAVGGLDSFKAYQSTNSGDTYVNASNASGVVRVNYETGAGTAFKVYGGNSSALYASFTGTTSIMFPGLAASSGHNCLQVDNSGYITNTGAACGTGSGGSGTVSSGSTGQIAYYTASGTAVGGESQVPVTAGGTGAATAAAALTNLGAQAAVAGLTSDGASGIAVTANGSFGGKVVAASVASKNLASIGPRYDVTQFGAIGNGTADDTAAIQAAFNACWANGTGVQPYGGVVEFPGNHSYLISSTINAYDSCRMEGVVGAILGNGTNSPPEIRWNGSTYGATASLTGFTVGLNVSSITFTGNAVAGDTVTVNGVVITFVTSGATGNQVNIGASATATATALYSFLNASSNTSIQVSQPFTNPGAGVVDFKYQSIGLNGKTETVATSDSTNIRCQAAYYPAYSPGTGRAAAYQYYATISATNTYQVGNWVYITGLSSQAGMTLNNLVGQVVAATGSTFTITLPFTLTAGSYTDTGTVTSIAVDIATDSFARYEQDFKDFQVFGGGVGIYAGSRMDTGSHIENVWAEGSTYFGFYLPQGATNFDFSRGWRADSPGVAGIYARGAGFSVSDGQTYGGTGQHGAGIMLDNQGCNGSSGASRLTLRNVAFEAGANYSAGLGAITLLDCTSATYPNQFEIDMEGVNIVPDAGVTYSPAIVMSPQNDTALTLSILDGQIASNSSNPRWVGIPSLIREDMQYAPSGGSGGLIPSLFFAPSFSSSSTSSAQGVDASPSQCLGDCNIGQLWQYGINASAFLYSDTAYAALPNATTLYAGQVIAPPSYWLGQNGKRYALDVVYQMGTTGTPNGGSTTCSTPGGTTVLTCTSATDLSVGEVVSIGSNTDREIQQINAANPGAVLVTLTGGNLSAVASGALTFYAPVLGPEIQLPTKSAASPSTLAWSQGDEERNSAATVGGVAAWVNVAAGTPGTWGGIPLGNSSGQLSTHQVCGGTSGTSGTYCDGGSGTWTALPAASTGIFKLAGPIANTGNTTSNQVGFITIPAGVMGATSQLWVTVVTDACTATSGVPTSACTGTANTGTCSTQISFSNTAGSGGTSLAFNSVAATYKGTFSVLIQNLTASTQIMNGSMVFGNASAAHNGPTVAPAINTANASYINIAQQNSVSGDKCFVDAAYAQLVP